MDIIWALLLLGADLISSFVKWWPWSAWETTVVALLVYIAETIAWTIRVCAGVIRDEIRHHITGVSHLGTIAQAIEGKLAAIEKRLEDLDRRGANTADTVASIDRRLDARGW